LNFNYSKKGSEQRRQSMTNQDRPKPISQRELLFGDVTQKDGLDIDSSDSEYEKQKQEALKAHAEL
jgi:hypothetical protein